MVKSKSVSDRRQHAFSQGPGASGATHRDQAQPAEQDPNWLWGDTARVAGLSGVTRAQLGRPVTPRED
jgi:hypothetical protein